MAILTLFKSKHGAVNYVTPWGDPVGFVNGRYYTFNKKIEDWLKSEAETGSGGIYIDPEEPEVDTEAAAPIDVLRRKLREEIIAEVKAGKLNVAPTVNTGNSEQGQLAHSTQNTMGTATPQGINATQAKAVQVSGDPNESIGETIRAKLTGAPQTKG